MNVKRRKQRSFRAVLLEDYKHDIDRKQFEKGQEVKVIDELGCMCIVQGLYIIPKKLIRRV